MGIGRFEDIVMYPKRWLEYLLAARRYRLPVDGNVIRIFYVPSHDGFVWTRSGWYMNEIGTDIE
jgi:hypothetical protein